MPPKKTKSSPPPQPLAIKTRSKLPSALLMLALSALFLTLLFPPFYCWFLAPVALVPFTICIIRRRLSFSWLLLYYLAGIAFFLPNLFWIAPVTTGGYVALACYIAIYFPLYAFGVHRLITQLRMPAILAVPLVWTSVEFFRSSFVLGGFPWFNLGNCLAPIPLLIQTADLFAVWGLTFFIALLNGTIVDLLRLPLMHVHHGQSVLNPRLKRLTLTALTLLAFVIAYGIFRLNQSTTTPGPTIAVIQDNIPQSNKDNPDNSREIFDRHLTLTYKALSANPKPALIVWPETMVPGYSNIEFLMATDDTFTHFGGDPRYWRWLRNESRRYMDTLVRETDFANTHLLVGTGSIVPLKSYNDSIKQNRATLLSPNRGVVDTYSKVHLVPFGEFIPFRNVPFVKTLMVNLTPYQYDYSNEPGDHWTRFTIEDPPTSQPAPSTRLSPQSSALRTYSFGTPICFEDTMPYPARHMVTPTASLPKADFLVNISNEGWFHWVELDQHLQASCLRAVENRVPIARSVNTGNSGFIDSNGRIVKLVRDSSGKSIQATGIAVHQLQLDSRQTIYTQIGDIFPILCGIASTLTIGWTLIRPRKGVLKDDPLADPTP